MCTFVDEIGKPQSREIHLNSSLKEAISHDNWKKKTEAST